MRIIVDVPQGFVQKIKTMIDLGKYANIEEFIEVSLLNQLKLETEEANPIANINYKNRLTENPPPVFKSTISNILSLNDENYKKIKISDVSDKNNKYFTTIWGQYNKIFPVKVTLRMLLNSLNDEKYINLNDFSKIAIDSARILGLKLLDADKMNKKTKGEKLSTALPVGDDPYKSKNRFMNHFIGYLDSEGRIIGAPGIMNFISLVKEEKTKIGITSSGLQFASLENPILDQDNCSNGTLSNNEIEFLIDHIKNIIPDEFFLMKNLLLSIQKGKNRPSEQLQEILNIQKNITLSQAGIVRGGLVSRMVELKLIESYRIGMREIGYNITERGTSLLEMEVVP